MKKLLLILLFFIPYFVFSQSWFSFKIIGFSKNGLISYTTSQTGIYHPEPEEDESDEITITFHIYDLKSDKYLYSREGTSFFIDDYKNILSSHNIIINTSYAESYPRPLHGPMPGLNKEKIISLSDYGINDKYYIDISTEITLDSNDQCQFYNYNYLFTTSNIFLKAINNKTSKYLGKILSPKCSSSYELLGYYKSPYENRVALLFYSTKMQPEEEGLSYIRFVGANLNPSTF